MLLMRTWSLWAFVLSVITVCGNLGAQQNRSPDALWRILADGSTALGPTIAPDDTLYVATRELHTDIGPPFDSGKNEFWAVTPHGKMKWRLELGKERLSVPVVAKDGTLTVIGSKTRLVQLSPEGKRLREIQLLPSFEKEKAPWGFVGGLSLTSDGSLFCVNAQGKLLWRCTVASVGPMIWSEPQF
jgi:outer membrane protein assembly factor BamB